MSSMRKILNRILESGINHCLTLIWTVLGVGLLILLSYLTNFFQKYWLFIAGFISAWIIILGISIVFIIIRSRSNDKVDQDKLKQYLSNEKGYIDHRVDMEETIKKIIALYGDITKETNNFNKILARLTDKIQSDKSSVKIQKIAGNIAKEYEKYFSKIEKFVSDYEKLAKLHLESSESYFKWYSTKNNFGDDELKKVKDLFNTLLVSTRSSLVPAEELVKSYNGLKGVTKDLNTSLNYGIDIFKKYISVLKKSESDCLKVIQDIDQKIFLLK